MDQDRKVDGYIFLDEREYQKAQKEKKIIDDLKKTLNPEKLDSMYLVYNKLLDKKFFSTPVGLGFLHDMREYLTDNMPDSELAMVPVPKRDTTENTHEHREQASKKDSLKRENDRLQIIKNRLTIAVVALCVIVIGMFFIIITNKNVGYFNAEEKVLNKYSAWQERLESWEEELNEREEAINNLNN
ncbi:MAG: hypothetical protein ACI39Q_00915 [Wujia sp.]